MSSKTKAMALFCLCHFDISKKKKIICAGQQTEAIDISISDPILIEFRKSCVRLTTVFWYPD